MELLEVLLVQKQFVLAVTHLSRCIRLALAFGDGQIEVLGTGRSNVKEISPFTSLDSNGVNVLFSTVIPTPVRLVAIAFHNSDLDAKR